MPPRIPRRLNNFGRRRSPVEDRSREVGNFFWGGLRPVEKGVIYGIVAWNVWDGYDITQRAEDTLFRGEVDNTRDLQRRVAASVLRLVQDRFPREGEVRSYGRTTGRLRASVVVVVSADLQVGIGFEDANYWRYVVAARELLRPDTMASIQRQMAVEIDARLAQIESKLRIEVTGDA